MIHFLEQLTTTQLIVVGASVNMLAGIVTIGVVNVAMIWRRK